MHRVERGWERCREGIENLFGTRTSGLRRGGSATVSGRVTIACSLANCARNQKSTVFPSTGITAMEMFTVPMFLAHCAHVANDHTLPRHNVQLTLTLNCNENGILFEMIALIKPH